MKYEFQFSDAHALGQSMMFGDKADGADARLDGLGLRLGDPWGAHNSLVSAVREGDLLFVLGQLPFVGQELPVSCRGGQVDEDTALRCARQCGANLLAVLRRDVGTLGRVRRIVAVTAYLTVAAGTAPNRHVAEAASDVLVEVLGEPGRHTASVVGVVGLPLDSPVALDAVVALRRNCLQKRIRWRMPRYVRKDDPT